MLSPSLAAHAAAQGVVLCQTFGCGVSKLRRGVRQQLIARLSRSRMVACVIWPLDAPTQVFMYYGLGLLHLLARGPGPHAQIELRNPSRVLARGTVYLRRVFVLAS